MTILTLDALRENPWKVVSDPLPANPSADLLEVAYHAAQFCVVSEFAAMEAVRDGHATPSWWRSDEISPDAHEESEARWIAALNRLDEINSLRDSLHDPS